MVPQRVSLVTIGAWDLPKLRSFYQQLGWEETKISSDTYAVFKTAGVLLSLFPFKELLDDAEINVPAEGPSNDFKGITLAINVDKPEDVDSTIEIVKRAGARIIREPSNAFWGGRTSYFADPENNFWEVAWNPSAVFDERGAMIDF